jgi:glycylpeptide N-tetradecanoyltransferase
MSYPSTLEAAKNYKHKFWSKQPIMGMNEIVSKDGQISELTQNQTPTKLPADFEWVQLDLSNKEHMERVLILLNTYYTSSTQFSQIHTEEFMKFYYNDKSCIHLCVKSTKHNLFVGYICGKIVKTQLNRLVDNFVEVRLLCVHQQLRNKKLTPCLITELNRQYANLGYTKGFYSSNVYINKPLISSKYYLRPINVDKLLNTGFLKIDTKNTNITVENIKDANQINVERKSENFVKMEESHVEMAYNLFNSYIDKYNYHPIFTIEEFTHLFYNNKFVKSYVFTASDEDGEYITDFASYYTTEIEVLKSDTVNKVIKKGNLFYYTSIDNTPYSILKNLLIMAKENYVDVFSALNIMEHGDIMKELNFEEFGHDLHYYLYNYRVKNLGNNQIGIVGMN